MIDVCPHCGWTAEDAVMTETESIISEGYRVGRKGGECNVPEHFRDMPSKQGDWKHGWRQGHAVFEQTEEGR